MDPFRIYLKIKIQEGKEEPFQSLIPTYIEKVQQTEPSALQFEAFINEDASEVIWLESYVNNTSFDGHLSNPDLEDLKRKMMPLQESVLSMYFMSPPTKAALEVFRQRSINPIILDPWPGTIRLNEKRNEETNIQTFAIVDLSDLAAYRRISEQVEMAASVQPDIHFHRSYEMENNRVAVMEEYKNSNALLTWASVFAENAGDFNSLVREMTYEVCGTPTVACKEMLDNWGAIYFDKIAGFSRFPK